MQRAGLLAGFFVSELKIRGDALVLQSPYLVGSGPFAPETPWAAGLAFASAAFLRASASASARFAAGVSCLRSPRDWSVSGNERIFCHRKFPAR